MKDRITSDSSVSLGLAVWLAAVSLLPFLLGTSGAPLQSLAGFVLAAGLLLSIGEAAGGTGFWRGKADFAAQSALRCLGVALPAVLFFSLGSLLAPAAEDLEDDVCALGGYAEVPDGGEGSADGVIDGSADCLPPQD